MNSTPRLAVIHTVPAVRDDFASRFEAAGLPDATHLVDASLLADLLAGVDPSVVARRLGEHLDALAENDLVVLSCSSLTPLLSGLRADRSTPVIAVDEPMAARAASGRRIAVLCTAASTVAGSTRVVEHAAEAAGRDIELTVRLVDAAFDALQAGDRDRHDQLVEQAAVELSADCDVLVLAQASLARLHERLEGVTGVTVLSSPPPLIDEIRSRLTAL